MEQKKPHFCLLIFPGCTIRGVDAPAAINSQFPSSKPKAKVKVMLKLLTKFFLILLVIAVFGLSAMAQHAPSSTAKKSGASASCDGALDIVPSKAMSFVRKRRPAKTDGKQQSTPADSKSEQKQPTKKGS
ncbi:MAG TPA: hypothetical protein VGB07_28735 [Blastocatellia bacterium]